ncbi:uncharacterized protein CTRU02_214129 [Colletotrichum truncatum]|uniref:Integral membrane protein n=1 Tax=Colletotrichum truncatum TaxID=5467 RepID=A0ACC3YHQ4_COLTU|nr:uncharacterized protein CTRU02_06440 [Colletotrichum truncatum]KAF6792944.1 integral membrane protein [Colletotrichum truncatum]
MAESSSVPFGAQPTSPSSMPPALPPVQLDFVYNMSQAQATVAFGAIVTIITTVSVVVRLYTRYFITKQVRIDDAFAIIALLCTFSVNVMQSVFAIRYLPIIKAMIIEGHDGSKLPYAVAITYNVAMACLKLTFLFQFYHIFRHVRVMKTVYLVAILTVGAWSLAQIILAILVCVPIQANWDLTVSGAVCLPTYVSTYINATGTMVTDIIVLFLPLPTLWGLKLRGRQRWAVFGVFGIGAIVPIISAGRIWSLTRPPPKGYLSTACWTIAELGVGVTTASLATIRHLLDRKVNGLFRAEPSSEGAVSQDATQQYSHQRSGSEVDLIHGGLTGRQSALSFKLFSKKRVYTDSTLGAQDQQSALTPNKGSTKTNITSTRSQEMSMSEGAATFLGEFGIRVEKTWVVEEIRLE